MNTPIDPCAPHLAHPHLGTVPTAGAIAAADATDRLLSCLYVAAHIAGAFECREVMEKARKVAEELCDYAALAGENAAYFLRSIAQIHHDNRDYDRPIAEALALLGRVASRRRVA